MYCDPVQYFVQRICENCPTVFACTRQCLNIFNRLFSKLGMEKVQQLAVKDAIGQECKEQNVDDKFTWILQGISVKFLKFASFSTLH